VARHRRAPAGEATTTLDDPGGVHELAAEVQAQEETRALAATIELSDEEESELRAVLRAPSASQQEAMRARIALLAAEGASNTQIAARVGDSLPTVGLWRRNFSVLEKASKRQDTSDAVH
jgi:hypothetical protein